MSLSSPHMLFVLVSTQAAHAGGVENALDQLPTHLPLWPGCLSPGWARLSACSCLLALMLPSVPLRKTSRHKVCCLGGVASLSRETGLTSYRRCRAGRQAHQRRWLSRRGWEGRRNWTGSTRGKDGWEEIPGEPAGWRIRTSGCRPMVTVQGLSTPSTFSPAPTVVMTSRGSTRPLRTVMWPGEQSYHSPLLRPLSLFLLK